MHIAHLTNALKLDGTGHTNAIIDVAVEQVRHGDVVTILCGESDIATRGLLAKYGVRLVEGFGLKPTRALFDQRGLRRLELRRHDVLHYHTVKAAITAVLALPTRAFYRSVATLHNPHQRSTLALAGARRVVVLSHVQKTWIRRHSLSMVRPTVVRNASLNSPRLPQPAEVQVKHLSQPAIVFVGALHRRKGLDVLLQAMQQVVLAVPTAHLYIVGNRDDPSFEEMAIQLGLEANVSFEGFSPDPRVFLLAARVLVLPSREEGFGLVLTEAREAGIPIVATTVGGIPEALDEGKAGLLVAPENPLELSAALITVLTDPAVAARLRVAGSRNLENFRASRAVDQLQDLYRSLKAGSRRHG